MIVGSVVGWLASLLMKVDAAHGLLACIVAGIVGSTLSARFLSPVFGASHHPDGFSLTAMMMSLLGAALLLIGVSLLRRTSARVSQRYPGRISELLPAALRSRSQ